MSKSFARKCIDLKKGCMETLGKVNDAVILEERDRIDVEWTDCDGNVSVDTLYGIDAGRLCVSSEFYYPGAGDGIDQWIECNCSTVAYGELSMESLCAVADLVNKSAGQ